MGARQTKARLLVEYDDGSTAYHIDEIKEFHYSSDMTALGDACEFIVVGARDGSTLRKLRSGSLVKLWLSNPAVNGGRDTLKHLGRIITRDADDLAGVIRVGVPDLGWHLLNCSAPNWISLRGLRLDEVVNPAGEFIDPSFGLRGLRVGKDANKLNRYLKQGRASIAIEQAAQLGLVNIIQTEPGETFHDVITRYATRENLLVNVACDGYLQVWEPDYSRPPAYRFYRTATRGNVIGATRHDDVTSRYTEVRVIGEVVNLGLVANNPKDVNATKTRGTYSAARPPRVPPLPFTHRLTVGDGEMWSDSMAAKMAEWKWKRGLWDSHYLEITVPDHYQIDERGTGTWYEADQLCEVDLPGLDAQGLYYVQAAHAMSVEGQGDVTKLILRWPWLLSASFGSWSSPPTYRSKEAQAAVGAAGTATTGGSGS